MRIELENKKIGPHTVVIDQDQVVERTLESSEAYRAIQMALRGELNSAQLGLILTGIIASQTELAIEEAVDAARESA
jgi:anthranilate phosphoribosyltransferase